MDEHSKALKDCLKEKCQSNEFILRQGIYIYISIIYNKISRRNDNQIKINEIFLAICTKLSYHLDDTQPNGALCMKKVTRNLIVLLIIAMFFHKLR